MIKTVKRSLYMESGTLRGVFFVIIIMSIIGIVLYTQTLVSDLRKETRNIVEFYAQTFQRIASADVDGRALNWVFENINKRTNFPLVLTQPDGEPFSWKGLTIPDSIRTPDAIRDVKRVVQRMGQENPPVPIMFEGTVINYLYYGDSKNIIQLSRLPYIALATMGLLVLIAFVGFNSIKKSEQRFIWVGMAKETAHQLGTPISSFMGWIEVLRSDELPESDLNMVVNDIQTDVTRLEKVAARFSQIGSQGGLKVQPLEPIFRDIIAYFHRRLPQTGKQIKLVEKYGDIPPVPVNRDLFEWALENLIKNSIDAMKQEKGAIVIKLGQLENQRIFIDIQDNGIGITAKRKHDIFKPGYSTKKRGWGLGLNLAKRIVEEYHSGRLFVKESHPGEGTTMRIELEVKPL